MNKQAGYLLLGCIISTTLFVGMAAQLNQPGFPLDDAWIHLTYARNLAQNGRFAYISGTVSAGSTAPLWTILLALGYLLRIPYLWWSYTLGTLSLWLLSLAGMHLWQAIRPQQPKSDWIAGLVLLLTWPLVWAAASGMETLLFAALGLLLLTRQIKQDAPSIRFTATQGVLSGLLILLRPDGLVVLLLILLATAVSPGSGSHRLQQISSFMGTAVLTLLPAFWFNWQASGTLWPNTFYAKQAEYAFLLDDSILHRFRQLLWFSWGGPAEGWRGLSSAHFLLLPGLLAALGQGLKKINTWRLGSNKINTFPALLGYWLPLGWAFGHVLLYAWRLPVTYQHGRYLFATIPIWVLYGLAGWNLLLDAIRQPRWQRPFRLIAMLTFALLLLAFLLIGGRQYAADVAIIESEMVTTAQWLNRNIPDNALIAAHDIGAIGYFTQRPLLDLAGLISPEIIPYLVDEHALADYILNSDADYLVTAPGWPYSTVTDRPDVVELYRTGYSLTTRLGLNNMSVYQLPENGR